MAYDTCNWFSSVRISFFSGMSLYRPKQWPIVILFSNMHKNVPTKHKYIQRPYTHNCKPQLIRCQPCIFLHSHTQFMLLHVVYFVLQVPRLWESTVTLTPWPVWRPWSRWRREWRRLVWRLTTWFSRWHTTLLTATARDLSTCQSSPSVTRYCLVL